MGKANDPSQKGLSGKIGNLVYYQRNGETYVRAAPGKQSKATKAKTSEPKRISQDVVRQTHAFLKNYKHLVRFGYQEHAVGAKTIIITIGRPPIPSKTHLTINQKVPGRCWIFQK